MILVVSSKNREIESKLAQRRNGFRALLLLPYYSFATFPTDVSSLATDPNPYCLSREVVRPDRP
jgi:hypothetical protein